MVSVEIAGPTLPSTITASPNQIRGLAAWVSNECVSQGGKRGGFATLMIANLIRFAVNPAIDLLFFPLRKAVAPVVRCCRIRTDRLDVVSLQHRPQHLLLLPSAVGGWVC